MSKSAAQSADSESEQDVDADQDGETPDVEEDLVTEELRIDGICGVY
ncbi:MAG: mycofactocin precursor MftA [Halobacteriaceae archaeon]